MNSHLNQFHSNVASTKLHLEHMANSTQDQFNRDQLGLAVENLRQYQTIVDQKFELLLELDPQANDIMLSWMFRMINHQLWFFKNGFVSDHPDKFVNSRPINR